jgi:hypothetical protein
MISVNFNLRNPWSHEFKNLWNRAYNTPFANKYIELEIYKDSSLASFMFNWTMRQSHAGVDLDMGLLGYNAHIQFYDGRHWNSDTNNWEAHD